MIPRLPLHWGHSKESGPRGCPSGHSPVLPPQPASPPTAPPLSAPSLGPRPCSTHVSAPFHPPIAAPPSRVVALGGSVTIRCEGRYRGMEFFLRKAGHPNLQAQSVPDWTVAEFPIPSVSREDGGSYTCDYRSITDQNRWSDPSDPVEIIVAGEGYPKPNISLSPSGGVSLGGAMTVRCWGQRRGVWFVLYKKRHHFAPVDLDGFEAVFPIMLLGSVPSLGRRVGSSG
uniref:Immunoglobulin domain-containing protein n=1 Tax=Chrysemys picta bellii TaxID=8478 RepID=A0A8C3HUE2_CHRPI